MYIYEDQYGWALAPKTNCTFDVLPYWNDFQRTYRTRAEAVRRMAEIEAELGS